MTKLQSFKPTKVGIRQEAKTLKIYIVEQRNLVVKKIHQFSWLALSFEVLFCQALMHGIFFKRMHFQVQL